MSVGTFRVTIQVGDPAGRRYEPLEALADTGATYTVVPASLLGRLGVTAHSRDRFVLADGREVERDIGRTWIRVDGRAEVTLVVFGEPDHPAVLGAYTLEGLRLAVDPVARRLVPVPGLLLCSPRSASRRLKLPPCARAGGGRTRSACSGAPPGVVSTMRRR